MSIIKNFDKLKIDVVISILLIFLLGILAFVGFSFTQPAGAESSLSNTIVTILFFLVVAVLFFYAMVQLSVGKDMLEDLAEATRHIKNSYSENKAEPLNRILNEENLFSNEILKKAFSCYKSDVLEMQNVLSDADVNVENYINYDLFEKSVYSNWLSQISGTMTGLGILGTFLGLSFGLNSFSLSGSADQITKEITPLMSGIKVAFHTSIYGLIYSIIFNFYYRHSLTEYSEAIADFIATYQKYIVPIRNNGSESSFIKYQKQTNDNLEMQTESNSEFNKKLLEDLRKYNEEKITVCNSQVEKQTTIIELQKQTNNDLEKRNEINNEFNRKLLEDLGKYNEEKITVCNLQVEKQTALIELQQQQNEATETLSKKMADEVSVMMKDTIIPEITKMRESVQEFARIAQENNTEALKGIVQNFIQQMNASLGDNFAELGEVLDTTVVQQKKNLEFIQGVLSSLKDSATNVNNVNKNIDDAVKDVKKYTEAVSNMQDVVNANLMSLNVQADANRELVESQKILIEKIISAEDAENNTLNELIEKLDKQGNILLETNSSIEQKIKDEFTRFASDIEKITNEVLNKNMESVQNMTDNTESLITVLKENTNNTNNEIKTNFKELMDSLTANNKEAMKTIVSDTKNCVGEVAENITVNQSAIQSKFNNFVETMSATNTEAIESIGTTMIGLVGKIDNQVSLLDNAHNSMSENLQSELKEFGTKINDITEEFVNGYKTILDDLKDKYDDWVDRATDDTYEMQNEFLEKYKTTFDVLKEKLESLKDINNTIHDDITGAAERLGRAAEKLDGELTDSIERTFREFDSELAEIVGRFSGTLLNIEKTLENTKYSHDLMSDDIAEKFEKMQTSLDQYLEYTDKLHHAIENKWNYFRNDNK